MKEFDPFVRGPLSVGVRSGLAKEADRGGREVAYEVWYPKEGAGRRRPLVLYSHASGGHRRQSSFLYAHLASHGYVVAAADHTGTTAADFAARAERVSAGEVLTPEENETRLRQIIADRVPDLRFLLNVLLSAADSPERIDADRICLVGWSFGGWAVLATPEVDDRIAALVALAPPGTRVHFRGSSRRPHVRLEARGPYALHRGRARSIHSPRGPARIVRADSFAQEDVHTEFMANDPAARLREHGVDVIEFLSAAAD